MRQSCTLPSHLLPFMPRIGKWCSVPCACWGPVSVMLSVPMAWAKSHAATTLLPWEMRGASSLPVKPFAMVTATWPEGRGTGAVALASSFTSRRGACGRWCSVAPSAPSVSVMLCQRCGVSGTAQVSVTAPTCAVAAPSFRPSRSCTAPSSTSKSADCTMVGMTMRLIVTPPSGSTSRGTCAKLPRVIGRGWPACTPSRADGMSVSR